MDRAIDIGLLLNQMGREKVERHVGEALQRVAWLVTGGERWGKRGFLYRPTELAGAAPSMRVMREQTFGSVVPMVGSLDEAIDMANSVSYALGANVYTKDFEKMLRCVCGIRAGTLWINDPLTDNDAAPLGGSVAAVSDASSAARASRPSRRRSTSTQTKGRKEGAVVPLWTRRRAGAENDVA